MDGDAFITSANQTYIFAPPLSDKRQVRLRADSRYGDDNPILWPQPYMQYNSHFGVIPQPNSLSQHDIIWWRPTQQHFIRHEPVSSPIKGLGKLLLTKFTTLKLSVSSLVNDVIAYETVTPMERRLPHLQPLVKWLEHGLLQLQSVYTTFRQTEFIVRDVQRMWLELRAVLDYMEIYKPRMDGHAPAAVCAADTIGVFTSSIQIAQDFFIAGLPCWLIGPSSQIIDWKITQVVDILRPEDQLTLAQHPFPYPVIFSGSASSLKKYRSIDQYARNFLCFPNPFGSSTTNQTPTTISSGPSGHQPVAGSSSNSGPVHSGAQSQRYHPKKSRMIGGPKTGKAVFTALLLTITYYYCRSPKQP